MQQSSLKHNYLYNYFLWKLHLFVCEHSADVTCQKASVFSKWSPPWIQLFPKNCDQSSACMSMVVFLGSVYHSNHPSVQYGLDFPLAATAREVGYSPLDPKLNNIRSCSHRDIKMLWDGLKAFTFVCTRYQTFVCRHADMHGANYREHTVWKMIMNPIICNPWYQQICLFHFHFVYCFYLFYSFFYSYKVYQFWVVSKKFVCCSLWKCTNTFVHICMIKPFHKCQCK